MRSLVLTFSLVLFLPLPARANVLVVRGSEAMFPLGKKWADGFMQRVDDVNVQVAGGGAATGIKSLIGGSADACLSIRAMRPEEREAMRTRYATNGVGILVARKAVSIYVSHSNPTTELTVDQVRKIFTGEIANWKDLGGPDEMITLYTRDPSSESYALFRESVLEGAPLTLRALPSGGNVAVATAVSRAPWAIGFGSVANPKGVKVLKLQADASAAAVAPTPAAVQSGSYPLARPLYLYVRNEPHGRTKAFVDWILSTDGQAYVTETNYFRAN
jgi:phosphate transport system substrate-binding protein